MAALQTVRKLAGRVIPEAICVNCAAERLSLDECRHANDGTGEPRATRCFDRRREGLSVSVRDEHVIRRM